MVGFLAVYTLTYTRVIPKMTYRIPYFNLERLNPMREYSPDRTIRGKYAGRKSKYRDSVSVTEVDDKEFEFVFPNGSRITAHVSSQYPNALLISGSGLTITTDSTCGVCRTTPKPKPRSSKLKPGPKTDPTHNQRLTRPSRSQWIDFRADIG